MPFERVAYADLPEPQKIQFDALMDQWRKMKARRAELESELEAARNQQADILAEVKPVFEAMDKVIVDATAEEKIVLVQQHRVVTSVVSAKRELFWELVKQIPNGLKKRIKECIRVSESDTEYLTVKKAKASDIAASKPYPEGAPEGGDF